MAIQKDKTLPNGAQGNYWRILSIVIDRQAFVATGRIALFKDKAASDAGKPPLGMVKSFNFTFQVSDIVGSTNIISLIYSKITTKAETLITHSITGELLDPPVPFDPDLAGGTPVL